MEELVKELYVSMYSSFRLAMSQTLDDKCRTYSLLFRRKKKKKTFYLFLADRFPPLNVFPPLLKVQILCSETVVLVTFKLSICPSLLSVTHWRILLYSFPFSTPT